MPPLSPPPMADCKMAFDTRAARTVLHGRSGPAPLATETWEWDGNAWAQVATGGPGIVSHGAVAWDASRQRTQLVTLDPSDTIFRFWEWDGANWSGRAPPGTPAHGPASRTAAVAHEPGRDVLLLHDGVNLWVLTPSAADATDYGAGCGGANGAPVLSARARPRPGEQAFALEVIARASPTRPAAVVVTAGAADLPLGSGCRVLVQAGVASPTLMVDGAGFAAWAFPVPRSASLRGVTLFAQAVVLDPAAPLGAGLSQGVRLTVGD
jgi:hypothetical protein